MSDTVKAIGFLLLSVAFLVGTVLLGGPADSNVPAAVGLFTITGGIVFFILGTDKTWDLIDARKKAKATN